MRKGLLLALLLAAAPVQAQTVISGGGGNFSAPRIADAADASYPNQTYGQITINAATVAARKKTFVPSAAGTHEPGALFSVDYATVTDRTAPVAGIWNSTYLTSGKYAGSYGIYNYLDVTTATDTSTPMGALNQTFVRAGSHTNTFGEWTSVYAQNTGNITNAFGGRFHVENDGSGTIANAVGVVSTVTNAGGGPIGQGIAFYAASNTLPYGSKASYYAEPNSGQAEFDDGTLTPILSHNATSLLTISSNVIAPTNGLHSLGAGLVKTITVPTFCSPNCLINIVPTAAFTTDTTGNIRIASTAVIGRLLTFAWDGTKWNPSY